MIGRLARWGIDVTVLVFAGYAFVFVPLGKRTALEHLRAIAETDAARSAGREFVEAGERLKDEILGTEPIETRGRPIVPKLRDEPPPNARWVYGDRDAGADASL